MEGIGTALERVQTIERQLHVLQQRGPEGFRALLSSAATTPATTRPASAPVPAAAHVEAADPTWTAAVQRPPVLRGSGLEAAAARPVGPLVNGQLPDAALVPIGGGHRLRPAAAAGFLALRDAAARDGVTIRVNDSYRTLHEQHEVAAKKGLYSQGGLAAKPGTSNHGLGLSVDLGLDREALAWMRTHAAEHGYRNDVPRESWHWTYQG